MDWKPGLPNLSCASVFLVCVTFLLLAVFGVQLIASVSGIEGITEPVYMEIADYYDNRKAAVTITTDDWENQYWQEFEDMSKMLTEKHLYFTGAISTMWDVNWPQIQHWLDQGYLEAASHSRTHNHLSDYHEADYDWEIGGSKDDIIGNLTLPPSFSCGSREYVYSWIEPFGESDTTVRQKLGYYKYLADRSTRSNIISWATWNSANGLFNRIGYTIRIGSDGTEDITTLNSKFDSAYDADGIYHLMSHPRNVNWKQDQYADSHTDYISNRYDVWYVNFGHLYLYRWIATQNVIHVTSTGSQDKIFKISISSTDRQNYGAKYPVTYVFDIPPSWTDAHVNYRFRETDPWATMETKTPSDFFNGINAVRFDLSNHKAYVSIGFSDVSNEIHLQLLPRNQVPVAEANGPYTGTEGVAIAFDGSDSYDPDGAIASYFWDFGDGETSTKQNPTHTYTQDGKYTVTLTVTGDNSATDTDTTTATVADTNPTADFSATPTSGSEPLTVSFTDLSTSYDGITAWEWDFENDGVIDNTEQNPIHVYNQDGEYSVTLKVDEGDGDSGIETKVGYVTVTDTEPSADFSATPTSGVEPLQVSFTDTSTSYDGVVSWGWDFGDGKTSTEQNPTHKYPDDGTFNVSLTVTDADASTSTITKQVSVLNVAATADFDIVSSKKPTVNEDISFIDQSSDPDGFIIWRFWNFGDGTYSTAQNVTHRYSTVGTFNVNLIVTDDDGETGTTSKSVTIYDVTPNTGDDYAGAMRIWIIGGIFLAIGITVAGIFWSNYVKKRKAPSTDTA